MATDPAVTLRQVLVELKALRVRIARQIAAVQRALRTSGGSRLPRRAATRTKPAGKAKTPRKGTRSRPVGFSRDRQALAARLARKKRR